MSDLAMEIGTVKYEYTEEDTIFSLRLDSLKRHLCIVGATGTGKSTTAKILIHELAENPRTAILDHTGDVSDRKILSSAYRTKAPKRARTTSERLNTPFFSL